MNVPNQRDPSINDHLVHFCIARDPKEIYDCPELLKREVCMPPMSRDKLVIKFWQDCHRMMEGVHGRGTYTEKDTSGPAFKRSDLFPE